MNASTVLPGRTSTCDLQGDPAVSRIDLHLHSHASGVAGNWWVQALGMGTAVLESYTTPETAHALAKDAGMDFVVLTDHETIDGAVAIAHHPDVLVGAEVSTSFPEDGANADVLVYGLDADHLARLHERHADARELVAYLREVRLPYVLAHPLFEKHGQLDRPAIERRMALFPLWELVNGSRPGGQNRLAAAVAADAGDLRLLAVRHGLPVPAHRRIAGTGGSDDHAGLYPGAAHSILPHCTTPADVLEALRAGAVRPVGADGSPSTLMATGLRLAGHAAAARLAADEGGGDDSGEETGLRAHVPLLAALPPAMARHALVGRYESGLREAFAALAEPSLMGVFGAVGRAVEAHVLLAPVVGVHAYWRGERRKTAHLGQRLGRPVGTSLRVGLVVDGFGEVNGVTTFYRNLLAQQSAADGVELEPIRCEDGNGALRPIAHLPVPFYANVTLPVPSLPDLLDLVVGRGYHLLHVAAPGPLGVSALAAAQIAGVPVVGGYHTEFAAYARALTGDGMLGDAIDSATRAFYDRCAAVVAPSASSARSIRDRGFRSRRIEVLGNGVDCVRFHPLHRDPRLADDLGGGRTLLVYAGRVSREKGLDGLAAGYRRMRDRRDDVHLVVVGDGPFRGEMERSLGDTATFTGFLHGEAFARTLACCDLLVFPSETDTLGRVVIEAQASGCPAVVKSGGPAECIEPGVSGIVVSAGDDDALWTAVEGLVDDPARRLAMGAAGRAFAERHGWAAVHADLVRVYREVMATEIGWVDAADGATTASTLGLAAKA